MAGMFLCYNMFPTMFPSLHAMRDYLQVVKDLGFNSVWLNPIQKPGPLSSVMTKADRLTGHQLGVKQSLYAMYDHAAFDETLREEQNFEKLVENLDIDEDWKEFDYGLLHALFTQLDPSAWAKPAAAGIFYLLSSYEQNEKKAKLISQLEERIETFREKKYPRRMDRQKSLHAVLLELDAVKAIKAFTEQAKELGITPIFDLVLNHVAKDSPLIQTHPHWFCESGAFPDVVDFNYDNPTAEKEIISFWKYYIDKYVDSYGFSGIRVDCVGKIPFDVRSQLYDHLITKVEGDAIIFEEALFNDEDPKYYVDRVKNAGGHYVTGSSYYRQRSKADGQLDKDYQKEMDAKQEMVKKGVVHFSGSHDHYSCAMTVVRKLAKEELRRNDAISSFYYSLDKSNRRDKAEWQNRLLLPYIINLLESPNSHTETLILQGMLEKLAIAMFSSSAGYYMLSGDEEANVYTPMVYKRENGQAIYPMQQLGLLMKQAPASLHESFTIKAKQLKIPSPNKVYARLQAFAQQAISIVASELLFDTSSLLNEQFRGAVETIRRYFQNQPHSMLSKEILQNLTLSKAEQSVISHLQASYLYYVENEIHANNPEITNKFIAVLQTLLKNNQFPNDYFPLLEIVMNYREPIPRLPANGWSTPFPSLKAPLSNYIRSLHRMMQSLPQPKQPDFWCECFDEDTKKDQVIVFVRHDGPAARPYSIIVVILVPEYIFTFDSNTLEKLAGWLQGRLGHIQKINYPLLLSTNTTIFATTGVDIDESLHVGFKVIAPLDLSGLEATLNFNPPLQAQEEMHYEEELTESLPPSALPLAAEINPTSGLSGRRSLK